MQKLLISLFIIFNVSHNYLSSQKNDYIWLFGYGNDAPDSIPGWGGFYFDFNKNPLEIVKQKRNMNFLSADASLCSNEGELLLYSNQCYIANKYDRKIPQSDSILSYSRIPGGNGCEIGENLSFNSIFLPFSSSSRFAYYFILKDRAYRSPGDSIHGMTHIRYMLQSKIDLHGNNGEGEMVYTNKVTVEDTMSMYELSTNKHSDKKSWWIIMKKLLRHEFIRVLVSDDTVIRYSNQRMVDLPDYIFWGNGSGASAFSPDGTKYAWYDPYNEIN